jgi:hypothetical protein
MLQVYELPMRTSTDYLVHEDPILRRNVPRPSQIGDVIHEVSVHGDVVAVTFATVDAATGHSHQLLLVNFRTGAEQIVNQTVVEVITKLFATSFILSHFTLAFQSP